MELREFLKTFPEVFDAIDESVADQKLTPALILLYSAMERFGGYVADKRPEKRALFMEWVAEWMLKKHPLPCNERDLYVEKNRILNYETDRMALSETGGIREIYYVSGKANLGFLQNLLELTGKSERGVGVRVEDLVASFRNGLKDYLEYVEDNGRTKGIYEEQNGEFDFAFA